jgi:hypothetical protein
MTHFLGGFRRPLRGEPPPTGPPAAARMGGYALVAALPSRATCEAVNTAPPLPEQPSSVATARSKDPMIRAELANTSGYHVGVT